MGLFTLYTLTHINGGTTHPHTHPPLSKTFKDMFHLIPAFELIKWVSQA